MSERRQLWKTQKCIPRKLVTIARFVVPLLRLVGERVTSNKVSTKYRSCIHIDVYLCAAAMLVNEQKQYAEKRWVLILSNSGS